MAKIRLETGQVINFNGNPTPEDVEEVVASLGIKPSQPTESSVPKWGMEHPNLYGLAEAGKAVGNMLNPIVAPLLPKEQILSTPAGRMAANISPVAMTQMGIPIIPPFSMAIPPQLREQMGAEALSSATSPLNLGMAVGGLVNEMMPPIKRNVANVRNSADYAEKLRKVFSDVKSGAVSKFGSDIEALAAKNPDKTTSLRNVVDSIKTDMDTLPTEVKNVFRKTPILKQMLENPDLANEVSLKDTQDILNYLNTKVPKNIKASSIDLLDTVNDIRASQLDAFPEMQKVKDAYAAVAEPHKNLKNYFRWNRVIDSVMSDFGGDEGMKALRQIFPEQAIKEMGGYKRARGVLNLFRKIIRKGTKSISGL